MRPTLALLVLLMNSTPASAHPGHGSPEASPVQHYLTSPVHLWLLPVIFFATVFTAERLLKWSKRKR